ncbi:MAG: beta family protein [bacterium]|nr:beta family protein [bacterium]
MFNSKHYIPILKWKRAEQGALEGLTDENKKNITPLIQFVMPKQKPQDTLDDVVAKFNKQLTLIPDKIIEVWGKSPVFVDFSLLFTTELKIDSIKSILMAGNQKQAVFVPVIYLNDDPEIKNAACLLADKARSGLCLRLVCSDFSDLSKLNNSITEFISHYKIKEDSIDLLVDIKELDGNGEKYKKYSGLAQNIVNLSKWRTFIFSGSAFPKDLSQCKIDEENLISRTEWKGWKEQCTKTDIKRKPSFSDYTIQYPIYEEISQFFHPTSSIKYTLDEDWFIMKGKKQKFELYLASAAELVKDSRYYGENFSAGDKQIAEKAKHFPKYMEEKNKGVDIKGTGSTETWLVAGINHHMTVVATQISNLP